MTVLAEMKGQDEMDTMIATTQNMSVKVACTAKPEAIVSSEPLDQNPAAVYLAGLQPSGRSSMRKP